MSSRSSFKFVAERVGLVRMATLALLAGFGVVFAGVGCGGALGGECLLDSDCNANLICAYQFCHIPCTETQDCDVAGGEECLVGHETDKNPYNYCAIPIACKTDVECGDSRVCAEDQKCRDVCFQDEDCLGDQRCFHGSCRNVANPPAAGWDAPAGLGELCWIPSDCASKNCSNYVCVGCVEDFDCGGTRTCDKDALGGEGMCMEKNAPLQAKVTPIDVVGGPIRDAVPDSNGEYIYFVDTHSVGRVGPDGLVCTFFSSGSFGAERIAISSDDSTLFLSQPWPNNGSPFGISSIDLPDPTLCEPRTPQTIPWTSVDKYPINALVVEQSSQEDIISFTTGTKLFTGSANAGGFWMDVPYGSEIAKGGNRTFLLTTWNQLAEVHSNATMTLLTTNLDLNDYVVGLGFATGMATNLTGSTIYIVDNVDTESSIVAVDLDDSFTTSRYIAPPTDLGPFTNYSTMRRRIHRAKNRDLFTWVTGEGKLYLFEPQ